MAETFNLNTFLKNYQQTTYDPTKQHTAAEQKMEEKLVNQAKEAVKDDTKLLSLTLSEKMSELGLGEYVLKQVADSASNLLMDVVNPIGDYLEKYENIFDQNVYHTEIQSYAKQMFFSSQAMREQAAESPVGQKFVYDM